MRKNFVTSSLSANTIALSRTAAVSVVQPTPATLVSAPNAVAIAQPSLLSTAVVQCAAVLPMMQPAVTAHLEQVRWINPDLAAAIAAIRPAVDGVPREQITVPVSLTTNMSDEQLFEAAANPGQTFYLPRYRIVERNRQVQMSLAANPQGWTLTIDLEKYPAPTLGTSTRSAQAISHEVSVILQHRLIAGDANGGQKEWAFPPPDSQDGGLRAVLSVTSPLEMSLLFQVLTTPDYGAVLTVRRTAKVAIPVSVPNVDGAILSSDQGLLRGTWTFNLDIGVEGSGSPDIWWEQHTDTVRSMVAQGQASLAYLGAVDFDALTIQQLQQLTYSKAPINGSIDVLSNNLLYKGSVFAVLTNSGNYAKVQILEYGYNLTIRWVTYRPSTTTALFREVTRVLDHSLEPYPFVFPQLLYPYLYQGVTGAADQTLKPQRWSFKWQNRDYSYFQDSVKTNIIYYLPDCFKLVRRPESPHYPMVSIYFIPTTNSDEGMRVTLDYWAFPSVSNERLTAAAQALSEAGVTGDLVFQPLIAGKPRLFLKLPQPDGSIRRQEFADVPVELRTGFSDSLTMSMENFLAIYNALFSRVTQLFQGEVQIDFADDHPEILPFEAQMDSLVGEILDYTKTIDASMGKVQVTLKNGIESPIRLPRLVSSFSNGETSIPGIASEFNPPLPVDLPAGASLSCTITPEQAIPPANLSNLRFDLNAIQIVLDRDAIFSAILRPDCPPTYKRWITLKVRKAVFGDRITDISIDFKEGDTITFSYEDFSRSGSDLLSSKASISFPLRQLVNRDADSGQYEFRTIVLLRDGTKVQDPPGLWRTDSAEELSLSNSELPSLS
jgi:hypothetical protein